MGYDLDTDPASTAYQAHGLDKVSLLLGASGLSATWENRTCFAFSLRLVLRCSKDSVSDHTLLQT